MLERLFWPDLFILGGGASKRSDNYMQYLTVKTPVVIATMKNNAGIVGGALIAHEKRSRDAGVRGYAELEPALDLDRPSGSGSGRIRRRTTPACRGRSRRSGRA
jgi:hypothetical protein